VASKSGWSENGRDGYDGRVRSAQPRVLTAGYDFVRAMGMRVQPIDFRGPGPCTALTIGNVLAAAAPPTAFNDERSID
jgi:hypothetical protein